jgi:hypothetical protein
MSDVEDIVAILWDHTQSARNQRCTCGWRGDVSKGVLDPNSIYMQHRRHQAEMIVAAGFGRNPQ